MCQASTDRAAISILVMGDVADRRLQQWMALRQSPVRLDVAPAHPGAQAHSVVVDLDLVETGQFAHINEQRRSGETKRQNRQQLWPPAISFASPLYNPSNLIASASVSGQAYSNGGAFMRGVPTRP